MAVRNIATTEAEVEALRNLLLSEEVQNLMGAEEWNLTEEEEMLLWDIIRREEKRGGITHGG